MDKRKYDAAYIQYVERGDSAAVFIISDIVNSIDTKGKWIDVLETACKKDFNSNKWDFTMIQVELFPRKIKPVYPANSSEEDKKFITWQTAMADICNQREQGYKGVKFEVCPKLVNENKGKFRTVTKIWNRKIEQYVRKDWQNSDCEEREVKIPIKPEWNYHILSVKKLKK